MSHFTNVKTRFVEKAYLKQALKDLNYAFEEGDVSIRGFMGIRTSVEIKVPTKNSGYDIGFRKNGDTYEIVADWFGIKGITQQALLNQLTQRYAYHAARAKLEEQGFSLAQEETAADGRIRLVLRRMA